MTDIDNDLTEDNDEELDFSSDLDEEDLDAELDFDNTAPPDGLVELEIIDVAFRNAFNEEKGYKTYGLNVRAKLVDPDSEWNGTFLNRYIWLGNGQITGNGRAQWASFNHACGLPSEGTMSIRDFQPIKKTIGKKEERVLSTYSEVHVGAYIKTETTTGANGQEYTNTTPSGWMTLEELEEARNLSANPEF